MLENITNEKMVELLKDFLNDYISPSFGSLSKKEIDLRVFELFIKAGVIAEDASVFSLISKLKISRAKARSLIYDYNLRKYDENKLKRDLKKLLKDGAIEKSTSIKIEVDNPYLIDFIRDILKEHRLIADGSFKPEILILTTKAYCVLLESCLDDTEKKIVLRYLYGDNIAKELLTGFVSKLLEKYTGKDSADKILKLGKMIYEQKSSGVKEWIEQYVANTKNVEE